MASNTSTGRKTPSILITQSLQNDLVGPIGRYDEVPCLRHVGHAEARRLLGENPGEGPVGLMMRWAYAQPPSELCLVHVRDWHEPDGTPTNGAAPEQEQHCVAGTQGAEFAFPISDPERTVHVVDANGLSGFLGTELDSILTKHQAEGLRIGLIGVWTEAKVFFLTYELLSRYPDADVAICSALTASSSKANHLLSLTQMERLLRVRVVHSIGRFVEFLGGTDLDTRLPGTGSSEYPKITIEGIDAVSEVDRHLLEFLFRDAQAVHVKALAGGYSGNLVLSSASTDLHGREQVPHVVKIGKQEEIGVERTAFERVESVLGNNAPRIVEFADFRGRGAIKYRYAAMGGGSSATFKDLYCDNLSRAKIQEILDSVFVEQLGRLYGAAKDEEMNLLEYYRIDPGYASRMKQKVERVLGAPADADTLHLPGGESFPNPAVFYARDLEALQSRARMSVRFADVHGDLNASNIIIDGRDNVWLIDFAFTHYGHVLRDLIKFENDLMFIMTPVESEADLSEAVKLSDALMAVDDLTAPLPDVARTGLVNPEMKRTYETIRGLRALYPQLIGGAQNVLQVLIAQLWYSGRNLTYVESNGLQKLWALYTAGQAAARVRRRLRTYGPLRVDWLDAELTAPGKLGLTILPGRRDRGRSLSDDMDAIAAQGVTHVLSLLTADEYADYGADHLIEAYTEAGLDVRLSPMLDGGVTSVTEMNDLVAWISAATQQGGSVMVHCLGGLGRSGLVAACYLIAKGMARSEAVRVVRRCRSPKAIETERQKRFLHRYAAIEGKSDAKGNVFKSVEDVLDFAIGEVDAAMEFYRSVAAISSDARVRQMFERFVRDAEEHRRQLDTMRQEGTLESLHDKLGELEVALKAGGDTAAATGSVADLAFGDALRLAMARETASFKLFMKLAECATEEGTKGVLIAFAEDAARHRLQFEIELDQYEALQRELAEALADMGSDE